MVGKKTKAIVRAGAKGTAKALAMAHGVPPVGAALIGEAAGLITASAMESVDRRNRDRAKGIMQRLLYADENPEEFAEYLNAKMAAEDEEVIGALRSLINAAVDAVSPAAMEAMARLAREHLRKRAEVWIARGGLRVFMECTDTELAGLRQIIRALDEYFRTKQLPKGRPTRVALGFEDGEIRIIGSNSGGYIWADPLCAAPTGYRRLFRLLKAHLLGDEATESPARTKAVDAIAIEHVVVRSLAIALGLA